MEISFTSVARRYNVTCKCRSPSLILFKDLKIDWFVKLNGSWIKNLGNKMYKLATITFAASAKVTFHANIKINEIKNNGHSCESIKYHQYIGYSYA